MIKTRNILSISDIPTDWAYEYYLNLPKGVLRGSDYMTRSPFTVDYEPSFQLYKSKNNPQGPYYWRCFSSGINGTLLDLVAKLKSLSINEAFQVIKLDFLSGIDYVPNTQLSNTKGRVTDYTLRRWSGADYAWWKQFGISHKTLEKYNVSCMGKFVMEKIKDGEHKIMEFNNSQCYAYFTKTGDLARIYQPIQTKAKFIKVIENRWLQGFDQLEFKASRLLIPSSLKDVMAIDELGIENLEYVAPDSENILIRKEDMDFFKSKYSWIGTLFDNDEPGKIASVKYQEKYNTNNLLLELAKDPSDSIRDYSPYITQLKLMQLL